MKLALFWGNDRELLHSKTLRGRLKYIAENTMLLNCFDLSDKTLNTFISNLDKYKPQIIRGYSTAIYFFVKYCKHNNIHPAIKPRCIIITSDKVYKPQKDEIADYFNCEVFEEYGSREFGIIAHECEAHEGLHIADDLFIVEVLNPDTRLCDFKGKGEIVVTSLFNYSMPLIRYRLGDDVTLSDETCTCGIKLKLIKNIEGRIADLVITKSGKFIYGDFFAHPFYHSKGIDKYQVHQYEKGKVIINIVKNKFFTENEMLKILSELKTMVKDDLITEMKYVDDIDVTSSGKRRSVISYITDQNLSF
jgi:phenylacetate-CoA ligase